MILPSSLQLNTQTVLKCVSRLIASQYICKQYWTGLSRLTECQCKISDHFNNLNGTGNISLRTAWHTSITLTIIMFIRNVLLHYIEILILTSVTLGEYYFLAMGAWGRKYSINTMMAITITMDIRRMGMGKGRVKTGYEDQEEVHYIYIYRRYIDRSKSGMQNNMSDVKRSGWADEWGTWRAVGGAV